MLFRSNVLDADRQRITDKLLRNGYYKFNKDYICLLYTSPRIFENAGAEGGGMMQTVIMGVVNIIFTLVAIFTVDRLDVYKRQCINKFQTVFKAQSSGRNHCGKFTE